MGAAWWAKENINYSLQPDRTSGVHVSGQQYIYFFLQFYKFLNVVIKEDCSVKFSEYYPVSLLKASSIILTMCECPHFQILNGIYHCQFLNCSLWNSWIKCFHWYLQRLPPLSLSYIFGSSVKVSVFIACLSTKPHCLIVPVTHITPLLHALGCSSANQ